MIGASRCSKMTSRQIVEIAGRRGSRDPGYASAVAGASVWSSHDGDRALRSRSYPGRITGARVAGAVAETAALAAGTREAR